MLKKIKGAIFKDQIEIAFQKSCLNSQHDRMHLSRLSPLIHKLKDPQIKKSILVNLKKKLNSHNYILRLKSLIAVHYFIKKTFDNQIMELLQKSIIDRLEQTSTHTPKQNQQIKVYVEVNVICSFQKYLIKLCLNIESYKFAFQFNKYSKSNTLDLVNHGFQTLNLINIILQMQEVFSKMGRYYNDHLEIVSMFLAYLDDLTIYNQFIKLASSALLKNSNQEQQQQIKHIYLFLNQAQKTSDRLYQFYYIRYYYYIVKDLIFFPTFLTIPQSQYKQVKDSVRKVDKNLINLVKRSVNPETSCTQNFRTKHQFNQMTQPQTQNHNYTHIVVFNNNNSNISSFIQQ